MTVSDDVLTLHERLNQDAEAGGYHLNPDRDFTLALVEGLLVNEARYGYQACPCRLATGNKAQDLDIVCPCDYRDPDLLDWGNCYCALYVSAEVVSGQQQTRSIPERRSPGGRPVSAQPAPEAPGGEAPLPVWRCRVCGYLCARDRPPAVCPICKAKQDRFERFW